MRPGLNERSNNKLVYIFYSPDDFYSVSTRRGLARRPRGPRAPLNSRATLATQHRRYSLSEIIGGRMRLGANRRRRRK